MILSNLKLWKKEELKNAAMRKLKKKKKIMENHKSIEWIFKNSHKICTMNMHKQELHTILFFFTLNNKEKRISVISGLPSND